MFIGECAPNLTSLDIVESAAGRHSRNGITMDVARIGSLHPNLTSLHCTEVGYTSTIEGIYAAYKCWVIIKRYCLEIAIHLPQIRSLGLYAHAYDDGIVVSTRNS